MIKGMTGFAQKKFSFKGMRGVVEIKSLNNRYLEIVCHLPVGFNAFEDKIKKILEPQIKRGRINVAINFLNKPSTTVVLNQTLAKEYLLSVKKMQKSLHLKGAISLAEVVNLPGVVSLKEKQVSLPLLWKKIEGVLKQTRDALLKERISEGRCLYQDICRRVAQIHNALRQTQRRLKTIICQKTKMLSQEELSAFLKSSDINEELVRIKFHLNTLSQRSKSNDSAGKELDFICQELLREINTTAAKMPDKEITTYAIQIKSQIERIREQAQNIE